MSKNTVQARKLNGFRDILPSLAIQKIEMLKKISETFQSFGFAPIETPHLEYADVLVGKGSDEIQKELYRFEDHGKRDVALRFDQTVPLARFTVENLRLQNISLPFKRYAIGNVFRGERAQKGRYREFTQCDFDFIGTKSLASDVEIIQVIYSTLKNIGIEKFTISLNNRKIMNGFFEYLGVLEKSEGILRIVDKIAKIGEEKVEKELIETEKISFENVKKILEFVNLKEENFSDKKEFFEKISEYKNFSEKIKNGVEELEKIYEILGKLDIPKNFYKVDFSIARGLGYYTGMVYETTLDDLPGMGSVCSGGRYDDLTKSFSNDDISGVGASIGLDRLLAALDELGLSEEKKSPAKVLIANMDEKFLGEIFKIGEKLRKNGIFTEIYPESVKLQKQFKFADKQKFEFILILGENEIKDGSFTLKNLKNGEQEGVGDFEELVRKLK
ncbi:histidine--tRNA ligase [Candidatus Gracilibacteria bacterium]|nr:histidine--tRNA ligase [Candidatus Gracilibacteria bacterium]